MQITFEKAIIEWKNYLMLELKPQSVNKTMNRFNNHILPYFLNINIYDLNINDIMRWKCEINKLDLKFSYKKILYYCFVSFINFCMIYYNLDKNVVKLARCFKNVYEEPHEMQYWTLEEFNQFIRFVDDQIYKCLFTLLYFTGLREGEALALTFNDISDDILNVNKTITKETINGKRLITLPKTKKSIRKILIDKNLIKQINELREYYTTKFNKINNNYFLFGYNRALAPTTIERRKNIYCEKAGVKQIRIHDFRHSHATFLINHNIPIEIVAERLGHSDINLTYNTYIHSNLNNEKRVINTLNQILV